MTKRNFEGQNMAGILKICEMTSFSSRNLGRLAASILTGTGLTVGLAAFLRQLTLVDFG